jgi:hypothetical protein
MGFISGGKITDVYNTFKIPLNLGAGLIWLLSETVVLIVLFTQLPVTVAEMSRNLYIPLLMVISAIFWGEGSVRKQLLWGVSAYIFAIPMWFR